VADEHLVVDASALIDLLRGAWRRRGSLRLADALYVELASTLGVSLITTDGRLARASRIAEVVEGR
jgi:predicted nucleic acid-binding protein